MSLMTSFYAVFFPNEMFWKRSESKLSQSLRVFSPVCALSKDLPVAFSSVPKKPKEKNHYSCTVISGED